MEIYYSSKFSRAYKRLSLSVKRSSERAEKIFRENPFDSRLKTHKLHGKYRKFCAFWVNDKYWIMFQFLKKDSVAFINIGSHDIYK